jgi:hypothetical protein
MANANGSIDEIIGQEAIKQIDDATAKMGALLTTFKESVTAVNLMNDALNKAGSGGSGGLKSNTTAINEQEKALKALIKANEDAGKEYIQLQQLTKQQTAANRLDAQSANASKGSYNELQANMQLLIAKYKSLSAEMRSGAIGKGLQADIANANKSLKDLDAGLGNMQRNVGNYGSALSKVWGGIRQLAYILPGIGIAGIFNLAGDAALALADKMDLFKKKVDDLGDALVKGQKDSTAEVVSLDHLYNKTQDVTQSVKDRKAAVDKLQELYPNYFKNVKDEDFLNGKAKKSYDDLKDSIIATAKAKAIEGRMTEIINNGLDDEIRLKENAKKAASEELTNKGQPIAIRKFSGINKEWSTINMSPDEANAYRIEKKNIEQKQLDDFKSAQNAKLKALEEGLNKEEKIINSNPAITTTKSTTTKSVNRIDDLKKQYEEEKLAIEKNFDNGFTLEVDYRNKLIELDNKYATTKIDSINNLSKKEQESVVSFEQTLRSSNNQNLKAIQDYYKNVTKDLEEYDKFVAKLNKEKEKDDKEVSDNFQKLEDEDLKYMKGNASNIIKANKDKNDKIIADEKAAAEKKKEYLKAYLEIYQASLDIIGSISDGLTAKEMQRLDARDKALAESNKNELRFIEQSGFSNDKKEKMKAKLAAETEAKQKQIDRDRVTALRKHAKLQKAIDINQAIANTALAVVGMLKDPGGYPGVVMSIAAAVTGAAQIAKIIATPLPQYAKGRKGGKAEHAIVGEIGQEAIVTTDGKVTLTPSTPSIAYIPQGADVIPHNELIKNSAYVALARQGVVTTDKLQIALITEFEKNTEKIDELISVTKSKNLTATYNGLGAFESYKQANIR